MEVDEDETMSAVDNAYAVDLFLTAIHAIVEKEDLTAVAKGDSRYIQVIDVLSVQYDTFYIINEHYFPLSIAASSTPTCWCSASAAAPTRRRRARRC